MRKNTRRCSRQRDPEEEAEMWNDGPGWQACYRAACAETRPGRWARARSCQAVHTSEGGLGLGADRGRLGVVS